MPITRNWKLQLLLCICCIVIGLSMLRHTFAWITKWNVKLFDRNKCYQSYGRHAKLYLERYYNLHNSDRQGLVICGHVLNYDTIPYYYCYNWNDEFDLITRNIMSQIKHKLKPRLLIYGSICYLVIIAAFILVGLHIYISDIKHIIHIWILLKCMIEIIIYIYIYIPIYSIYHWIPEQL